MTEKYYTPSIKEFHVGFEYERLVDNEWLKIIMSINFLSLEDIEEEIEAKEIRVKYLDKEDIESCGWVISKKYKENIYNQELSPPYELGIYTLQYNRKNYELSINITTRIFSMVYFGQVKNKSELKRIMKQLNII